MELRMQKHKINEERIAREKEKLKKAVERQSVQLEKEVLEKNKAMVCKLIYCICGRFMNYLYFSLRCRHVVHNDIYCTSVYYRRCQFDSL
jgi:hypothetical protein